MFLPMPAKLIRAQLEFPPGGSDASRSSLSTWSSLDQPEVMV